MTDTSSKAFYTRHDKYNLPFIRGGRYSAIWQKYMGLRI